MTAAGLAVARPDAPSVPERRPGRVAALDGLRGLAVTAVIVNHLRPSSLRGGWLGVDVFFVLSGFLITSILLAEHDRDGRIDLRRFYSRRARRLLPALFLLLVAVAVVARVAPGTPGFSGLRADGLAALGYVANWHFVLAGASYFGAFAPSPLRHLWSLSVEEQFYVVWPLVLVFVARRRGARAVAAVAAGLAVASAVAMALEYGNGTHVSRIYFGTDTHAHGALIGCALAALVSTSARPRRLPSIVTALALVVLGVAFVALDGTGPTAYRGGIAGAGLLTALLIAGVTAPGASGPAIWLLERSALRALGRISYGLYLWHWPVFELVTAARSGLSGWLLVAAQLTITLALALASFALVERPVLRGWPRPRGSWVGLAAAATTVVAAVTVVVPAIAPPFAVARRLARERSATTPPPPGARSSSVRRVVVVGDSVAYTLFPGLRAGEAAARLYFLTAAETGCPLDVAASAYRHEGEPVLPASLPRSCDWPRLWPAMIDRSRPDLVVALWGLWDLYDHEVGGRWLAVGTPAWTTHMERALEQAVGILSARGARVIVLTPPYLIGVGRDRVDALDRVYRDVAARLPRELSVVDIHPAFARIDPTRWDGVHFTLTGAEQLGRAIVPMIASVAPVARVAHVARGT